MAFDGFDTLARLLVEAALNGLWQGLVIAALVWAMLRSIPRAGAATRYGIWAAALTMVLALLFAPLVTVPLDGPLMRPVASASRPPIHLAAGWPPMLLAGWSLIAALLLGRLAWSYLYVRWLARTAAPLDAAWQVRVARLTGARGLRLCGSRETSVPIVVGLRRPVILIPDGLTERLSAAELDQIILHEWAHVRRRDHWSNCALELAKSLFFFHPAVWWIARRMQLERELACDDAVVAATGAPVPYAGCLAKLAELSSCPGVSLSPGATGDRQDVFRRVERLVHWKGAAGFSILSWAGAAAMLIFAAGCVRQLPALVDAPGPVLALRAPHVDAVAAQRSVMAEARIRTADIFMEAAAARMASAERLMRAAREQMRLAQIAAGNGRLPISRVSCPAPASPANARLNRI